MTQSLVGTMWSCCKNDFEFDTTEDSETSI